MYEEILHCYISFSQAFHCSFAEIDEMDLSFFLDIISVNDKVHSKPTVYIDQIL